jgi:serine/threonine protein kinase
VPQCPTCGRTLDDAARFCPNDGTTIKPEGAKPASAKPEGSEPEGNQPEGSRPANNKPPASKTESSRSERNKRQGGGDLFARPEIGAGAEASRQPDALLDAGPIVLDGRYRIKARLGAGGVGAVYSGEHVETRRPVAIKVLHAVFAGSDEFHKRFEREARAASKLTHPSCVSVLDYGRVERVEPVTAGAKLLGTPYLVMEFVRGTSLADHVGKPMPPTEAVVSCSSTTRARG